MLRRKPGAPTLGREKGDSLKEKKMVTINTHEVRKRRKAEKCAVCPSSEEKQEARWLHRVYECRLHALVF